MSTPTEDGRAAAIQHAIHGADAWRSVVHAQLAATSDHGDFYALAGEVVETLRCLESLAGLLTNQVASYGRGRTLRDDEAGHDPTERLAVASSWAGHLRHCCQQAERAANQFWSEVGHIAVEESS
jgi:hypothetical protein